MNSVESMSSIYLTTKGKLEYNITWLQSYQQKIISQRNDTKNELDGARIRLASLKLDGDWIEKWNAWKPSRPISNLISSLAFYQRSLEFLQSKEAETRLLIKVDNDPEEVNPVELAQHQVEHQTILDRLEKTSPPDCEELLAEIERGLYMVTCDDDEFEVKKCVFCLNHYYIISNYVKICLASNWS